MDALIRAGVLEVAIRRSGPADGWPVVLLHGFPYDGHAYDEVAPLLVAAGAYVIVPTLRGYGQTRFLEASTLRSGQQAAMGRDLLALLDALELPSAILAGYDWGARAACIVAALWPARAAGLVSVNGYCIQNIARSSQPAAPDIERRQWYQYYLHSERGRAGLAANRRAFAELLWRGWSPTWAGVDTRFEHTAPSFDNPDFVDVVVHSYRHRYGLVAGDPAYQQDEEQLAGQPRITVDTITLDGADDGVNPAKDRGHHEPHFERLLDHRVLPGVGHNLPQEAPAAFAAAVLDLHGQ
ncbi:MAG: alpha/beta hydrolase fold protein [Frankiales bacterium]|nr:alpha/beta hydrolase fold protein [Frankiales bacterium]